MVSAIHQLQHPTENEWEQRAILDLSKIIMYDFHYDYVKPKYGENLQLCCMDSDSFIYDIKTDDFYKDIADDVNDSQNHPLLIRVNKKVIELMKDELGKRIMTKLWH